MAKLPLKYAYLNSIGVLPRTVSEALKLYGTAEVKGNGNNPAILKWAKDLGHGWFDMDSIPWCGLFADLVAHKAGKTRIAAPLWARNWVKFGLKSPKAGLGDFLVFVRDGGGHVGIYVGESKTTYHVLGGNQSDKVSICEIEKSRCIAVRRPKYNVKPANVKAYHIDTGGTVSVNEA